MAGESVRAFIAVKPSSDLHGACSGVAAAGRQFPLRWVRPESVHLTLKFLGEVSTDAIPAIRQSLRQAAKGAPTFSVAVRGLGCFPNVTHPRVLWMGLDDPQRELLQLQQRIESTLAPLGLSMERRLFRPHLTLARARGMRVGGDFGAFLSRYKNRIFGCFVVSHIHLMQSDLRAQGAVHTCLHSVALQGSSAV